MEAASLLQAGLCRLDVALPPETVDRLARYCDELERWNRRINLVARKTGRQDLVEKHFLDSLALVPLIRGYGRPDAVLIDVGSGAGFPGLVLATALPELRVVLLEPRQKRVSFLRHVARELGVQVDIRPVRLEEAGALPVADFVTGRAVAAPARFLALVHSLLTPATLVVLMGGGRDADSLREAVETAGLQPVESVCFDLPFSSARRRILLAGAAGRSA